MQIFEFVVLADERGELLSSQKVRQQYVVCSFAVELESLPVCFCSDDDAGMGVSRFHICEERAGVEHIRHRGDNEASFLEIGAFLNFGIRNVAIDGGDAALVQL